jgi:hypothetical protein
MHPKEIAIMAAVFALGYFAAKKGWLTKIGL